MKYLRIVFYILLAILLAGFLWLMFSPAPDPEVADGSYIPGVSTPRNRHDADRPRAVSEESFDPRFIILSAVDRARIPVADRFDSPLGSEEGAFIYDAQPFNAENAKRGGRHSGQDLNGIGGKNTDEGDNVYASGRGMVVYTGTPSPEWGKVVIIAHRLPEGEIIQTLYAHLKNYRVHLRQLVSRGEKIGEVGSADGLYWAHLHYEAMVSSFNEAGLPGYLKGSTNRFNPQDLNTKIGDSLAPAGENDIFSALENLEIQRNTINIQPRVAPSTPDEG